MALYEPPYFADWTPERLKKEIKKLQEKRDPIQRELQRVTNEFRSNDETIREMQFILVCNSGLRDALQGWGQVSDV